MHLFELLARVYKHSLAALYYHLESFCLNKLIGVFLEKENVTCGSGMMSPPSRSLLLIPFSWPKYSRSSSSSTKIPCTLNLCSKTFGLEPSKLVRTILLLKLGQKRNLEMRATISNSDEMLRIT